MHGLSEVWVPDRWFRNELNRQSEERLQTRCKVHVTICCSGSVLSEVNDEVEIASIRVERIEVAEPNRSSERMPYFAQSPRIATRFSEMGDIIAGLPEINVATVSIIHDSSPVRMINTRFSRD